MILPKNDPGVNIADDIKNNAPENNPENKA